MPNERRRQRSTRIVVASILLVAASLLVTSAVVIASQLLLIVAALAALVAGFAAARIISNELAHTRREWARDRAQQAKAYQGVLAERTREQARFAAQMSDRIAERDTTITELNGTLRLAERRADLADKKVHVEKRRNARLQERVDTLLTEQEQIAAESSITWDGTDVPTIVDLLKWEQSTAPVSVEDDRKQA